MSCCWGRMYIRSGDSLRPRRGVPVEEAVRYEFRVHETGEEIDSIRMIEMCEMPEPQVTYQKPEPRGAGWFCMGLIVAGAYLTWMSWR